jgi:hypothetical protein
MFAVLLTLLCIFTIFSIGAGGSRGHDVSRRFRALGNLYGKSKREIIDAVGAPSSVSYLGRTQLVQWNTRGYHIALRFDENEMFAGIQHEFAR